MNTHSPAFVDAFRLLLNDRYLHMEKTVGCPGCGATSGVQPQPAPPKVQAWTCTACGMEWAITCVNPHLRPACTRWWAVSPLDGTVHLVPEGGNHPRGGLDARCGAVLPVAAIKHDQPPPGPPCESCRVLFLADFTTIPSTRPAAG